MAVAVTSGGCSSNETPTPRVAPQAAPAAAPAEPVPHAPVPVFIDDRPVVEIPTAKFVERSALADVLPPTAPKRAQWTRVQSRAEGRRRQNLTQLDTRFSDHQPRLFVHPVTGQPAFGMFGPEDKADGTPKIHLDGLSEIRISTLAPPDLSTATTLTVTIGEASHEVTAAAFDALKDIPAPEGSGGNEHPGHLLRDLLKPHIELAKIDRLRLHSALFDTPLEISGDALRDDGQLVWIKKNREGLFRFKLFEDPTSRKAKENMRALVRIEVVPVSAD